MQLLFPSPCRRRRNCGLQLHPITHGMTRKRLNRMWAPKALGFFSDLAPKQLNPSSIFICLHSDLKVRVEWQSMPVPQLPSVTAAQNTCDCKDFDFPRCRSKQSKNPISYTVEAGTIAQRRDVVSARDPTGRDS